MAPELVIADTPYKEYPGGVIAVRCADHLAAARGTLSTESDDYAHDGEAVRETQQVDDIEADQLAAYATAEDTLVLVDCPLQAGVRYYPHVSYRLEGYTDVTDTAVLVASYNERHSWNVIIGFHGTTSDPDETTPVVLVTYAPSLPHYRQAIFQRLSDSGGNPTISVRVAIESGTTYEVVIDQITFVPDYADNTTDFPLDNPAFYETLPIDGADGGDINGKFTWTPFPQFEWHSGPGDFQRVLDSEDAEWFEHRSVDDFSTFQSSQARAHLYSINGAGYRGQRVWAEDTFDNRDTSAAEGTDSPNMGVDGTGFGYSWGGSFGSPDGYGDLFCDGAGNGIMRIGHFSGSLSLYWGNASATPADNAQLLRLYDQWEWYVLWEFANDGGPTDPITSGNEVEFELQPVGIGGSDIASLFVDSVLFSLSDKTYRFNGWNGGSGVVFGPVDISSWFGVGSLVGVRIEVKRYVVRAKVWDASGDEPADWDHEWNLEISGPSTTESGYPYDDELDTSARVTRPFYGLHVRLDETDGIPLHDWPVQVNLKHMKVTHDPYGDPMNMGALLESPEGTPRGEIEVPFGAHYFVYWGNEIWTEEHPEYPGEFYTVWASKVWNIPHETSAEIQRAEIVEWYLIHPPTGGIVAMNWREGDREPGIKRIHQGPS